MRKIRPALTRFLRRLWKDETGATPQQLGLFLLILALMLPQVIERNTTQLVAQDQTVIADRQETIRKAAFDYIDKGEGVYDAVFANASSAPIEIDMATLVTMGKITPSIVDTSGARTEVFNGHGAKHVVLVRAVGTVGLEMLTAAIGGREYPPEYTGYAVKALGEYGGLVYNDEAHCGVGITLCAIGNDTNYNVDLSLFDSVDTNALLPSAGDVVSLSYIGQGQSDLNVLYNTAQADPDKNSIFTDIDWNQNNILDMGDIEMASLNMQLSHGILLYSANVAPDTSIAKPINECAAVGTTPEIEVMISSAAAAGADEGLPMSQISAYARNDPSDPANFWQVKLEVTSENVSGGTPAADVGRLTVYVKCLKS